MACWTTADTAPSHWGRWRGEAPLTVCLSCVLHIRKKKILQSPQFQYRAARRAGCDWNVLPRMRPSCQRCFPKLLSFDNHWCVKFVDVTHRTCSLILHCDVYIFFFFPTCTIIIRGLVKSCESTGLEIESKNNPVPLFSLPCNFLSRSWSSTVTPWSFFLLLFFGVLYCSRQVRTLIDSSMRCRKTPSVGQIMGCFSSRGQCPALSIVMIDVSGGPRIHQPPVLSPQG